MSGRNLVFRLARSIHVENRIRADNLSRYILQCGLASLIVLVLLILLDTVTQTVLIASLGASAFIAFAVPHSPHASARHLIGGYIVGMACGCLIGGIIQYAPPAGPFVSHAFLVGLGAISIGLAMFIMVVTRTEHPPAASLALGLVINEWTLITLVVVLAGIVGLSVCKRIVLPFLMDLL